MKKRKILIHALILLLLGGGYFGLKQIMKPAKEELTLYENKVIETIDAQLKGLPIEKIREKSALIMEKSIEEIQASITKGELSYTELTAFYLDRIKNYDKAKKGINAVMEINPKAIEEAKKLDAEKVAHKDPIYGIPVLVKDNINTKDMATSAGTIALKDFKPSENAPLINKLLEHKAILLGKANLSELANYVDTQMPNGYSSKLGQTLNPFAPLMMSPLGSSSGSGAAVAANFSAVALGTETTGSIISPSHIHSLVGFKPTKDLISTEGVLPLSSTMDTVGPMAKNVKDAAILFNATISDASKMINITSTAKDLEGKRIGVYKGEESEQLVEALKKAGAVPVELEDDGTYSDNEFIISHDFRIDFEAYAKKYNAPVKSLSELVKFNEQDENRMAKYGQALIERAAENKGTDKEKIDKTVQNVKDYIKKTMEENKLDAISFINANSTPIPCIAGYPEITVPLGKDKFDEPMGATFFSLGGEDEKLLNLAHAFEQATMKRLIPEKYISFIQE